MTDQPRPPPWRSELLAEIAALTSDETALKLAREAGGGWLIVPAQPAARHRLTQIVGGRAAAAIARRFAPDKLRVPTARAQLAWHDARQMRRAGLAVNEICRRLRYSRSAIVEYVRDIEPAARPARGRSGRGGADPRQLDLLR